MVDAFANLVLGQDVGFVATPARAAALALAWVDVGPADVVYDLGCGDGKVAIEAARLGASAVCIESDHTLAAAAETAARDAGLDELVTVRRENIFEADVSNATVVYLYLLPALNARLAPSLAHLSRPTTRILTRSFEIFGWPCGRRARFGSSDNESFLFMQWRTPLQKVRLSDHLYLNPMILEQECAEHALECSAAEDTTITVQLQSERDRDTIMGDEAHGTVRDEL